MRMYLLIVVTTLIISSVACNVIPSQRIGQIPSVYPSSPAPTAIPTNSSISETQTGGLTGSQPAKSLPDISQTQTKQPLSPPSTVVPTEPSMSEIQSEESSGSQVTETQYTDPSSSSSTIAQDNSSEEIFIYPDEFRIYQDYLNVINGRASRPDFGVVEATVLSINRGEVCPYQEEICPIEPYPNDWGIVKVDEIISYTTYQERNSQSDVEEAVNQEESIDGQQTSENRGNGISSSKDKHLPLAENQEVQALFILTTRLVKVKYIPVDDIDVAEDSEQNPDLESDPQQTTSHKTQPRQSEFMPLPTEEGNFVFTTEIGNFENPVEKVLPGMEVGTKIRAAIRYDGVLYIEEYEVIQ